VPWQVVEHSSPLNPLIFFIVFCIKVGIKSFIVGNTLGTAVVNSDRHQLSIKMQVIQAIASCGSSLQLIDHHYCFVAMTKGSQSVRFD